ncbi:glycerate kinase [Aspergillus ambiguus]|uniref:glycerate kinase n=1 Tax=Aspergillus ambiguus TaxID=176160 RepID=UPI003CCCEB02
MDILVCPSGFKVSIDPHTAADCIEEIIRRGFAEALIRATNGILREMRATGILDGAALNENVEHIIIGCGDSGTSDGGAGMLLALCIQLIGLKGEPIPRASDGLHSRIKRRKVHIEVACNWRNVLCGQKGVARVYRPQKKATSAQTHVLETALDMYASVAQRVLRKDVGNGPGSGASGGLGTGLLLIGAELRPWYDVIMQYFNNTDSLFCNCELVITAGGIDYRTSKGKIPAEMGQRAKKHENPVLAMAGRIGNGADFSYDTGIDAYSSIMQGQSTLDEAVKDASRLRSESAESMMRIAMVGKTLGISAKPIREASN